MLLQLKPTLKNYLSKTILWIAITIAPIQLTGQFERFKTFDVADGICHPFVYTINQDKDGFVWFGTGEGLCRFDGFEFQSFAEVDSLSNDVVNVSYKDTFGKLWFGFNNGLVLSWDGIKFTSFNLPFKSASGITVITQTPWGEIFISTQNKGSFIVSEDGIPRIASDKFEGKLISTALFTSNLLLLGTMEGLELIPVNDKEIDFERAFKPQQLDYINIQVIKETIWDDIYLVGTEDEGLFLLSAQNGDYTLVKVGEQTSLAYQNIQDFYITPDKNLWICTYYSGLIKLNNIEPDGNFKSMAAFSKENGFPTNYIKSIYTDREENVWIGTYSNGVALLSEQSFNFMSFENELNDNTVLSVTSNDSLLWLGGESSLLQISLNNQNQRKAFKPAGGLPNDNITALHYSANITWIGTESSGIYKLDVASGRITPFFKTENSLSNSVNYLLVDNGSLYAGTKDGIYNFDLSSGTQYQYNTGHGLPHNDIEHLYVDSDNKLLFATRSNGIYEINDKGEVEEYFTVGNYELEFNSITQDVNQHVWVSTFGQGVFLLLPDTVVNFVAQNGLKSNYCYSLVTADSNFVWVGHRLGISRININDYSIKTFDLNIGIKGDCNQNAVAINKNSNIFFGTTDGLIKYDVVKGAKEVVPPKTNVLKLLISDVEYDLTKPIVLPFSAYKIRVEYVGLNYNDPDAVRYQYKLDGYDLDWSEITDQRHTIYSRIEDGEFKFLLRAYGADMNYEEELIGFTIKVKPPIWKKWWFILSVFILLILSVIVIIKYRERRQKEIQEYLEKRLDERTREVVEQKEEIEIKNRDITDSINYAQRIQTSILPPIKKLQQSFSGSFIYYQPRDIVSGDFYWFDRVADDRFVIVCADSTGHGVPGAFMSMIGTTMIKDICISQKGTSPAGILKALDSELTSTLHQNADEANSNDGMDIMVCEVNINTNYLRYSSAMRPMIVYRNGEQIYIKGSRSSIGGQYDAKETKEFVDQEMQLNAGDLIYMFSDGYPDQFGGPLGKKFKMVRLKNLLKDIHKKPMEEQYDYVKSTFNLWKEEHEQVDDVLFMGIKL